jgi:hypothetical protein
MRVAVKIAGAAAVIAVSRANAAMTSADNRQARWHNASFVLGSIVWLVAFAAPNAPGTEPQLQRLLLLAILVLTPLALALVPGPREQVSRLYTPLIMAQPFASLLGAATFLLPVGPIAGALAAAWLVFTALAALYGLMRLLPKRLNTPLEEVCISLALMYWPVGAGWLVASRLGLHPLGFGDVVVLLTAVHFHFIPLAALILTGMIGRIMRNKRPAAWGVYRAAALGLMISPAFVALGITYSLVLESIAAAILALSMTVLALLSLLFVLPDIYPLRARLLIGLSALSVLAAMAFAGAYALGRLTGAWAITIPTMVQFHGWVNGIGFGLAGLLGWNTAAAASQPGAEMPPHNPQITGPKPDALP